MDNVTCNGIQHLFPDRYLCKKKRNQKKYGYWEMLILVVALFYACFIMERILQTEATINQIAKYNNKFLVKAFEDLKKLPIILGYSSGVLLIYGYKIYKNLNTLFKQNLFELIKKLIDFVLKLKNILPVIMDRMGYKKK